MSDSQATRREGFDSTGPIRKFLFLALGLTRRCPPQKQNGVPIEKPEGVRTSRRNIIALAGVLVLAGFADIGPGDLTVFGVKLGEGDRGATLIGTAAIVTQLYWYYLRYCHLRDDAKVVDRPGYEHATLVSINQIKLVTVEHKMANLVSNWVAFSLTLLSWCFIGCWIVNELRG